MLILKEGLVEPKTLYKIYILRTGILGICRIGNSYSGILVISVPDATMALVSHPLVQLFTIEHCKHLLEFEFKNKNISPRYRLWKVFLAYDQMLLIHFWLIFEPYYFNLHGVTITCLAGLSLFFFQMKKI